MIRATRIPMPQEASQTTTRVCSPWWQAPPVVLIGDHVEHVPAADLTWTAAKQLARKARRQQAQLRNESGE